MPEKNNEVRTKAMFSRIIGVVRGTRIKYGEDYTTKVDIQGKE